MAVARGVDNFVGGGGRGQGILLAKKSLSSRNGGGLEVATDGRGQGMLLAIKSFSVPCCRFGGVLVTNADVCGQGMVLSKKSVLSVGGGNLVALGGGGWGRGQGMLLGKKSPSSALRSSG